MKSKVSLFITCIYAYILYTELSSRNARKVIINFSTFLVTAFGIVKSGTEQKYFTCRETTLYSIHTSNRVEHVDRR